jgi:hypothetical protein
LLANRSARPMSTHFQFFPERKESIEETMTRTGVDFVLLFNTANYGYDRNAIDPLVKTVKANSELVGIAAGEFFDIGKKYFIADEAPSGLDTFFLYRVRK